MSDDEATELPRRDRPNRRNPADIDPELATNIYRNKKGGHSRDGLNEKLIGWDDRNRPGGHPDPDDEDEDRTVDENHDVEDELRKSTLNDLVTSEFYNRENWFEEMCEVLFKIKGRGTTIKAELYFGVIHFISCFYCIAVVPQILSDSKYDPKATAVAVSLCSGIGSIFCGLFANLPFVLAPPTVVSIFLAGFNEQNGIGPAVGNYGVMFSGALLTLFYYRPLGEFIRYLIPLPIQVGTAVGIGLLTCLAGSTEIGLVQTGDHKLLRMGKVTPAIVIAMIGFFMICVAMRYHIKGSFCLAVIFCTIVYWACYNDFPTEVASVPTVVTANFERGIDSKHVPLLTADLLFLYILYLNGLVTSLSNLAVLTRDDGAIPRGRWIFVMSGFFTICGGLLTSAPILVSPESSAAIKDGAKTGLSTVVAGMLFILAIFFSPLFESIPSSGTSPVLLMIGLILFQNVNRIDWRKVADAAPAFVVLFFIPFTYSIIQGVILGYVLYLSITLCTGELLENFLILLLIYFPWMEPHLMEISWLEPYLLRVPSLKSDAAKVAIAKAMAKPGAKPLRQSDLQAAGVLAGGSVSIGGLGGADAGGDGGSGGGYLGGSEDHSGAFPLTSSTLRNRSGSTILTPAGAAAADSAASSSINMNGSDPITSAVAASGFRAPVVNLAGATGIDMDSSCMADYVSLSAPPAAPPSDGVGGATAASAPAAAPSLARRTSRRRSTSAAEEPANFTTTFRGMEEGRESAPGGADGDGEGEASGSGGNPLHGSIDDYGASGRNDKPEPL